ncbi:hypothetical protein AGMMS49587_15780 [Spirochaetia bacterium]|nr:hypothetical protein AGMMS49587_15780 [Spirochaetia bacterium]
MRGGRPLHSNTAKTCCHSGKFAPPLVGKYTKITIYRFPEECMPTIKPSADLRNNYYETYELTTRKPDFYSSLNDGLK